jgi:nucleotide-binding universal stress UspA family protein
MDCKHILVPSDLYKNAQVVLAHALAIARRFSARITLFHVVTVYDDDPYNPQLTFPNLESYYQHLEEQAGRQFEQTIAALHVEGVDVKYVIQRGFSPYEEILQYAEENQVDLIVMGTHGRKALSQFFLGSVAQKVVHHAPCPVMTSRISEQEPRQKPDYHRILAPTDFSETSQKALKLAVDLLADGGIIDLLHVVEYYVQPTYFSADGEIILDISPQIRENSEKMLKSTAEQVPPHIQVLPVILDGSIAQQIVDYGESHSADLIVMGTHGTDAFSQLLIGSQTNRVIRKAACPVITVK